MYAAFPGLKTPWPAASKSPTRVDIELELGKRHFPTFRHPAEAKRPTTICASCAWRGSRRAMPTMPDNLPGRPAGDGGHGAAGARAGCDQQARLSQLLSDRVGFRPLCPERDIPATARGSGVGSLVAYALDLSHVCPLKYDLLFERFLDDQPPGSARYRHRLLQGPPRRSHPIRQGQVRRRKRGPDRHVRHAGRAGGDSRRGPGPGTAHSARRCGRGHGARRRCTSRSTGARAQRRPDARPTRAIAKCASCSTWP